MKYRISLLIMFLIILPVFALRPDYFVEVKVRNELAPYESDKRTLILTSLLNNSITSEQATTLLSQVQSDKIKLDVIKEVAQKLEDPENKALISATVKDGDMRIKAEELLAGAVAYKAPYSGAVHAGFMDVISEKPTAGSADMTLSALEQTLENGSTGLTGPVIAEFLREISHSYDRLAALSIMEEKTLSMTTREAEEIIKSFCFPNDKLTALRVIRDRITTSSELATLLDPFSPGVERALAYEILKDIKPATSIYGSINESTVLFVIDVSSSMEARFTTNGVSFSRLGFVSQELQRVLSQQFTPAKSFNIMVFSSSVSLWKSDFVSATPENVNLAISYIEKLRPNGGTNIYGALEKSFKADKMDGLYFLTDGVPTSGAVKTTAGILKKVQEWNSSRTIPVHTTAFLMGQYSSDNEQVSRAFMKQLADENGGVYRAIETIEDMGGPVQPTPITAVSGKSGGSTTEKYTALIPSIPEQYDSRIAKTEELAQERTDIKEIPSAKNVRNGWIEEGSCLHKSASASGSSADRRKQMGMQMKLLSE